MANALCVNCKRPNRNTYRCEVCGKNPFVLEQKVARSTIRAGEVAPPGGDDRNTGFFLLRLTMMIVGMVVAIIGLGQLLIRGPILITGAEAESQIEKEVKQQGGYFESFECPDANLHDGEVITCTVTTDGAAHPLAVKATDAGGHARLQVDSPDRVQGSSSGLGVLVVGLLLIMISTAMTFADRYERRGREGLPTWRGVGKVALGVFAALAALGAAILSASSGGDSTNAGGLGNRRFPMSRDRILGAFGGTTIYQRPDGSKYGLDRSGRGSELPRGQRVSGPAQFDSRGKATGNWSGSSSVT